ncbi:MAG: methyltransferase domain-containing protein [Dolichospermum sp.]|jgi:tRNA (cmo5U34)-methyltransferase
MNNYHVPSKDKWEFDQSVTDIFDDMLARSIPQYEVMRKAVTNIACNYLQPEGHLLDLGCSRGDQIARLISAYGNGCNYHGIECSESMIIASQERFKNQKNVELYNIDLRKDWVDIKNCNVILSVLTLQFIPIEYRLQVLQRCYDSLSPGGAIILVEKVIGNSANLDSLMTENYYNLKHENGYSIYEIERKRLSLEGVLVPVTAKWNEELLCNCGFKFVDCFWRWFNFMGLVAVK